MKGWMTQINFGVKKDMEIPFGISLSIIKVKHWQAFRTRLESADSILSAADLKVQFLGQVTDRYSEIKGVISPWKNISAADHFHWIMSNVDRLTEHDQSQLILFLVQLTKKFSFWIKWPTAIHR